MKTMILAAASGIALTAATPAFAADMAQDAVQTVEVPMSEERYALALAAVDAYWPQGLSAFTTDYFVNTFANEMLYTPLGELAAKYEVVEIAADVAVMMKQIEELDASNDDGEGEDEGTGLPMDISPEQALKGMIAMFEDQRLVDILAGQDEHFEERLEIVRGVINEEMPALAAATEPKMRQHFATMFARRFNDQELRDLAAFAATPTGQKYAREQWVLWTDPAYFRAIFAGAPESLAMSKSMMEKLESRMAHLPPMFPEPESSDDEEAEEAAPSAEELIAQAEELEAEAAELMESAAELRAEAAEL